MILFIISLFILGGFLIGAGIVSILKERYEKNAEELIDILYESRIYLTGENQKLRNRIKLLEKKDRR